jgi:predicted RNase H-like HicB family nuclease
MKHQFTAILEQGEKYLIATCPEVPEAAGQGETRESALQDLAGSIGSMLEYRREEALSRLAPNVERTVLELP